MEENFEVKYSATPIDEHTEVVTGYEASAVEKRQAEILAAALDGYNAFDRPEIYSVSPNEEAVAKDVTLAEIDNLSVGINSSLEKVEDVNRIILKFVNSDPLMGFAYDSIMANVPTAYDVAYVPVDEDEEDTEEYEKIKNIVERFNRDIKMKRLIPQAVSTTWLEGNTPIVFRTRGNGYVLDILPLAIMHPSKYRILGDDVMQVEVDTLKARLQKSYPRSKRTKKSVYFDNIGKEIQSNFSPEIYKAYRDKESICRMPTAYADCLKINNCNRDYGVSPFFRSLRPLTILKNLENADASEARARSKYIIFQKLRKEVLGDNPQKVNVGIDIQALSHANLSAALKTNLAAYTGNAAVDSVEFVSAKSTGEDSVKLNTTYTTKYLDSLGISWTDTELPNGTMANLSVRNLIKSINAVLHEIERVLNKFYLTAIREAGITDPKYVPELHIASAETMEASLKKDIAQFVYGTLNGSLTTAFKLVDIDIENEARRRIYEKEKGYDEIFTPHATAYTTSGNEEATGRPAGTGDDVDVDKQQYDQENNESKQ